MAPRSTGIRNGRTCQLRLGRRAGLPALISVLVGGMIVVGNRDAKASEATLRVGIQVRDYTDESRRSWDGNKLRPEHTTVWYPTDIQAQVVQLGAQGGAPFVSDPTIANAPLAPNANGYPLILISHGTGGSALGMQWLAARLALRGFIVAAVDHHGNTGAESRLFPQGFLLWWERPRDLSVVLDRMLADPAFSTRIDRTRIGAAGFSLGGYTVLALSGARLARARFERFCNSIERDFTCGPQPEFPQALELFAELQKSDTVVAQSLSHSGDSYQDARVRAVYAMAPVFGMAFDQRGMSDIRIPVRVVVGAGDTVAPPATNALRYKNLIPGASLNLLNERVGHYDFAPDCTAAGRAEGIRICEGSEHRGEVHQLVVDDAARFFERAFAQP